MRKTGSPAPLPAPRPPTWPKAVGKNRAETPLRHGKCSQAVKIGHVQANRVSLNLGIVPGDGKEERRVVEHAEIVGVVRVLPHVIAVDDQVLAKSLLKAGVEFVALPGTNRSGGAEHGGDDRIGSRAGQHQIFIEGAFQHAGVGSSKDGIARTDVVGDAEARFDLSSRERRPRYRSPRRPRLKDQGPVVIVS